MQLHLIQPVFHSNDAERETELRLVETINRARFGEAMTTPEDRLEFTALLEMCRSDAVNVLANSDIAFDETADLFGRITGDEVWCMSRWDQGVGGWCLNDRKDSQDAWVIRGVPRHRIDAPFLMGQPGCDNRLVHLFTEAGYTVRNPSRSIRYFHHHASDARAYRHGRQKINVVPPPYGYVSPHRLRG